jgi:hypothetical protein
MSIGEVLTEFSEDGSAFIFRCKQSKKSLSSDFCLLKINSCIPGVSAYLRENLLS